MFDDFDDIWRIMDRVFGVRHTLSPSFIDYRNSERIITNDTIFYTLVTNGVEKEDIHAEIHRDKIIIHMNKLGITDSFEIIVPYPIIPDNTITNFNNGILDIEATRDKYDKDIHNTEMPTLQ